MITKSSDTKFSRTSKQRNEILRFLENTLSHPTAEDIYAELKPKIPSISLSTIYRNLAQFEEDGLITRIQENNQKARFDANLIDHAHVICTCCNQISDVKKQIQNNNKPRVTEDGFTILFAKHRYIGICSACKETIRKIIEDNKVVTKTTQFIKDFSKTVTIIRDANTWVSIFELDAKTNLKHTNIKAYIQIGMNLGYIEDDGQERYKFIKSKEEKA